MRCKSCDYPLWNIKARQCPECGADFLPSNYDFVINSVKFCCPHCEQVYYGTGVKGHLVPQEFNCVTCGQRVHMDQMMLRPAEGVTEDQTQIDRMPWLERKQRGFIKAWVQTVGKSMVNPASLMRGVPIDDRLSNSWFYAILTWFVILVVGLGFPLLVMGAFVASYGDPDGYEMMIAGPAIALGGAIGAIILIGIWGAIAHGMLRMTGGAEHTIGRTYQSLLYSAGTNVPMAAPCIGPYCVGYLTWIWWGISATLMLAHGQRVHAGRAALAVFTFPCLVIVASFTLFFGAVVWNTYTATKPLQYNTAGVEVSTLTSAVLQHAAANNGAGPVHALELVTSAQLATPNFCSMYTATDASRIKIAGTTLDRIDYLPPNRQSAAIQSAGGAAPANVVAHRCGDFVFTYHGIDLNNCDPNLWVVVYSPDPDQNPPGSAAQPIYVGLASGTVRGLPGGFAVDLTQQNTLRAAYNLPPLPDPATVTHQAPAVEN